MEPLKPDCVVRDAVVGVFWLGEPCVALGIEVVEVGICSGIGFPLASKRCPYMP